jgi:hypothetical protein
VGGLDIYLGYAFPIYSKKPPEDDGFLEGIWHRVPHCDSNPTTPSRIFCLWYNAGLGPIAAATTRCSGFRGLCVGFCMGWLQHISLQRVISHAKNVQEATANPSFVVYGVRATKYSSYPTAIVACYALVIVSSLSPRTYL